MSKTTETKTLIHKIHIYLAQQLASGNGVQRYVKGGNKSASPADNFQSTHLEQHFVN